MRWTPRWGSPSHENDRERDASGAQSGGPGLPLAVAGALIALVLALLFGPGIMTGITDNVAGGEVALTPADSLREKPTVQRVSLVLDDAQRTWAGLLRGGGVEFRPAKLAFFRDGAVSACGNAPLARGPFYCPLDETIYLDVGFLEELDRRFGAAGDFAQAYVIAHELGHHIQHLAGIDPRAGDAGRGGADSVSRRSLRLELQADCYAGVWAHFAARSGRIEPGDASAGLAAASAVGSDRIRGPTTGGVIADAFSHGSARDRAAWFARGLTRGRASAC